MNLDFVKEVEVTVKKETIVPTVVIDPTRNTGDEGIPYFEIVSVNGNGRVFVKMGGSGSITSFTETSLNAYIKVLVKIRDNLE